MWSLARGLWLELSQLASSSPSILRVSYCIASYHLKPQRGVFPSHTNLASSYAEVFLPKAEAQEAKAPPAASEA